MNTRGATRDGHPDGRRTDTRRRIQDAALQVFAEHGWEGATLREIADRIGITRPALYYHFRSKEEILAGVHRDLAGSVDDILGWAEDQVESAETRAEILRRMSALMSGSWGAFLDFAQRNEAAMRDLKGAGEFTARMDALGALLRPADTIAGRIKGRLALDALFMADARGQQLGGSPRERRESALAVATALTR